MKNKENEKNKYMCVKCETGETDRHGLGCSCNKKQIITKEEFLNETNEDEIFCLIDSFLMRYIRFGSYDLMDKDNSLDYEDAEKNIYQFMPTDKQKAKIIKHMIKNN